MKPLLNYLVVFFLALALTAQTSISTAEPISPEDNHGVVFGKDHVQQLRSLKLADYTYDNVQRILGVPGSKEVLHSSTVPGSEAFRWRDSNNEWVILFIGNRGGSVSFSSGLFQYMKE